MQDAYMSDDDSGGCLMILLGPDKKAGVMRGQSLPLAAISANAESLGYSDAVGAAQATSMIARRKHREVVNGHSFLAEAQAVIAYREEAREAEAFRALEEGRAKDPRSPALRGALAARRAVLGLTGAHLDSESVLAACQRQARQHMGLPEPVRPPSSVRGSMRCGDGGCAPDVPGYFNELERRKISELLRTKLASLRAASGEFCHSFTDNEADPLKELALSKPSAPTLSDVVARYGMETPA